jgi:hypothetical protein
VKFQKRLRLLFVLIVEVEFVKDSMSDGGEYKTDRNEKDETCEQGVDAGEELSITRLRQVHWTHATQQHGSVEESVDQRLSVQKRRNPSYPMARAPTTNAKEVTNCHLSRRAKTRHAHEWLFEEAFHLGNPV